MDSLQSTSTGNTVKDSLDGLEFGLNKCLRIQGEKKKKIICNDTHDEIHEEYDDGEEEDEEEEEDLTAAVLAQSGYKLSPPHPSSTYLYAKNSSKKGREYINKEPYDEDEEEDELSEEDEDEDDITEEIVKQMGYYKDGPLHSPSDLPPGFELKSAMKGSREKLGKPLETRNVAWSPDVRDPTPTSSDNYATSKTQRQKGENKASGKNRQKWGGKASGEGKIKERAKKQVKKSGGGSSSSKGFNLSDDGERVVDGNEKKGGKPLGKGKGKTDKKHGKKHGGSSGKFFDYN